MFDLANLSNETRLFFLIIAMAIVLVYTANMVQKQRALQAYRLAQVQRLRREISHFLEPILRVDPIILNREIRLLLRREALNRYYLILQIEPHQQGARESIVTLEEKMQGDTETPRPALLNTPDVSALDNRIKEINEMRLMLRNGHWSQAQPETIQRLSDALVDLRADYIFQFYSELATIRTFAGDKYDGLKYGAKIIQFFAENGPVTPYVRVLYERAEKLREAITKDLLERDDGASATPGVKASPAGGSAA